MGSEFCRIEGPTSMPACANVLPVSGIEPNTSQSRCPRSACFLQSKMGVAFLRVPLFCGFFHGKQKETPQFPNSPPLKKKEEEEKNLAHPSIAYRFKSRALLESLNHKHDVPEVGIPSAKVSSIRGFWESPWVWDFEGLGFSHSSWVLWDLGGMFWGVLTSAPF